MKVWVFLCFFSCFCFFHVFHFFLCLCIMFILCSVYFHFFVFFIVFIISFFVFVFSQFLSFPVSFSCFFLLFYIFHVFYNVFELFFHFSPGSRTMSISCLRIGMLIGKMVWPVMNTENEPTLQGWCSSRWYLAYETFCSTYAWARMTLECALLSLLWVCEIH